jgi:hypothetical protein
MNLDLIAENMRGNIQKIDRLQRQIKEDIRDAHQKKQYYDYQIKEYKKLHDSNMAILGGGWLIIFMELSDRVKRDNMLILIGKNTYKHTQLAELTKVAHERMQLIREAKREGVDLSEESQKLLKEDKLSFLIDSKEREIFEKKQPSVNKKNQSGDIFKTIELFSGKHKKIDAPKSRSDENIESI